jgi:AcrR family transcriptional regulator
MTPPRRKPLDLESLIRVAFRLFRRRGYEATSVDQIARAAGITKSGIYHHVSGKEELLERGIDPVLTRVVALLDEPGARTGDPLDRLRYLIRRTVEIELSTLDESAVFLQLRGNTKVERRILERRREYDVRFVELMEEAVQAGRCRSDLDPRMTSRLSFGMTNWLLEWYDPAGELSVDEIADSAISLIFEGLLPRRTEGPGGLPR